MSLRYLGDKRRRPLLLARTSDQELIMYEVYPFYDKLDKTQLKMRFKRVQHGLILRERKSKTKKEKPLLNRCQIRYFKFPCFMSQTSAIFVVVGTLLIVTNGKLSLRNHKTY